MPIKKATSKIAMPMMIALSKIFAPQKIN